MTVCGLDGPGFELRWEGGQIFHTHPDQSWGQPSLLYKGRWVSFQGVKWLDLALTTHPPPYSAKVKNKLELYLIPVYVSSDMLWGDLYLYVSFQKFWSLVCTFSEFIISVSMKGCSVWEWNHSEISTVWLSMVLITASVFHWKSNGFMPLFNDMNCLKLYRVYHVRCNPKIRHV
jgi:hypothetical protein